MQNIDSNNPTKRIDLAQLKAAVASGVLSREQAQNLWALLEDAPRASTLSKSVRNQTAGFNFIHTLYYFGGMLAIGAMTLFMTLSWDAFGAWGVCALATAYFVGCCLVARNLQARDLAIAAGIFATLAVCLVPLIVWAMQHALALWPDGSLGKRYSDYHAYIDWRWLTLEFATLAAAVIMLRAFKLPFMVMPVAVTLWYMSMDVASALMQQNGWSWQFHRDVTLVFGLATCAMAVWVDIRCRRAMSSHPGTPEAQDFAYWLYLFGAIMAWSGLSFRESGSEIGKLTYCVINVGLVFLGAVLQRGVFTVLGGLGVALYLGDLSHRLFKDSVLFPFALTVLGLAVVGAGIWWQRNEESIYRKLSRFQPAWLHAEQ